MLSGRLRLVRAVLCAFVASALGRAEPQPTRALSYDLDSWREANGVTLSRIRHIIQRADGYVWFSTVAGAVRFDGTKFTTFDVQSGALGDNEIWAMRDDPSGALWIGTVGGGLSRYEHGVFTRFTRADGLPDNVIRWIDIDAAGNLWVATLGGICRRENGAFRTFTHKDGLASDMAVAVCATPADGVFAIAGGHLHRFEGERWRVIDLDWPPETGRPLSMRTCRDGSLWITYENGAVKRLLHGSVSSVPVEKSIEARDSSIYEDTHGTVWMGARDGLRRLDNGVLRRYQPPGVLDDLRGILSMGEDREGGLWFGFESSGLARLHTSHFKTVGIEEGLAERASRTVFQDHRGDIWIGTASGPARYREGRVTNFPTVAGAPLPVVTGLTEDSKGTVWFAAAGMVYWIQNDVVAPMPGWSRTADIKGFYRDPRDRMWLTTDGDGLFMIDQAGRKTQFRTQDGLPNDHVRGIIQTRDGSMWLTTFGGGVARYADGKFTCYSVAQGLGSQQVVTVCELTDGSLWFGTRGGITRYQNGRFRNFDVRDGLPVNFVSTIIADGRGALWFTCDRGIFRVELEDFDAVATGRRQRVSPTLYGANDGLRSTGFMAGHQPSAWRTPEGQLLFPSLSGLVVVDPALLSVNQTVPPVRIEQVMINRTNIPLGTVADIAPGRGEVLIDYTALSFAAPEKVRFRYRLEGYDTEWVDGEARRFAHYASLPPGKYTFRVTACNNDGVWNESGASVSFRLRPYFYRTTWFYAACGVVLLGAVRGFYSLRLRRVEAHKARLQREVADAMANMKVLRGMLPICASCKRVREDSGYWQQIETYIRDHSETEFTHGLCPECVRRLYPIPSEATPERDAKPDPNKSQQVDLDLR